MEAKSLLAGGAAVALAGVLGGAPARGGVVADGAAAPAGMTGTSALEDSWQDRAIRAAFRDVLDREPSERELRRYRGRMQDDHWTEKDVRDDLRSRSDYRRHSGGRSEDPDRIVRRAYEDILDRQPDPEGRRLYRSRIIDQDWTEHDVREALRNSPEYEKRSERSADKIVRRAYEDVLKREPDRAGLESYRNRILREGWDEQDVREALSKSPEYRQKSAMTREQAEEIVRRAYRSVLEREPDPGSRGYVDKVLRQQWTEEDVARDLRKSDEYRKKHR